MIAVAAARMKTISEDDDSWAFAVLTALPASDAWFAPASDAAARACSNAAIALLSSTVSWNR